MPRTLRPEQIMPQVSAEDIMRMYNQMNQGLGPPPSEGLARTNKPEMTNDYKNSPLLNRERSRMPQVDDTEDDLWDGDPNDISRPSESDVKYMNEHPTDGVLRSFDDTFGPGSARRWSYDSNDKAMPGSPLHNRTRSQVKSYR